MCDRADPLLLPRDQRGCHGLTRHRPVSQHSNSQLSRALSQRGPSGVVSAHHQRTPGTMRSTKESNTATYASTLP